MYIAGLQKLTIKDFPGLTACIVFTQGCNFKCPYCHNSELIPINLPELKNMVSEDDFFKFLDNRVGLLDGVVISGGEPTIQNDLKDFISKVKSLGFKVKLDTNGSNPSILRELINNNLLDYVAMDIKNDFENYGTTCGVLNIDTNKIKESISLLDSSNIQHEYRTTISKEFHSNKNIQNIIDENSFTTNYFIQNFEDSENVIDHSLHSFSNEELEVIEEKICKNYQNVSLRK